MHDDSEFTVPSELTDQTVAAVIKRMGEPLSWSEVKRLILSRHVRVNGTLCLDDARRMKAGDRVTVTTNSSAPAPRDQSVQIIFRDEHLVVIDKPAGIQTVRRPEERDFSEERKKRHPTLDELVASMLPPLGKSSKRGGRDRIERPKVRAVHRLDRDTSGLMLFALSPAAETALIKLFAAHTVQRTYTAIIHGILDRPRTIETWIVRDRGDGLRGSLPSVAAEHGGDEFAKRAVTHVRPIERIAERYSVVTCRLETGRTHQIRIHLSEIGHRLCGEQIYTRSIIGGETLQDDSGAPRQALHSIEVFVKHPITGADLRFTSPLPKDLARWLASLRR
jgi:23S rRNA pseudouridine1911/1915/1917 synthase